MSKRNGLLIGLLRPVQVLKSLQENPEFICGQCGELGVTRSDRLRIDFLRSRRFV